MRRSSVIKRQAYTGDDYSSGPDTAFVVEFYENEHLVETRMFPNKSIHYVEDAARNWDNGVIKNDK
tara:strand:+ start:1831 stop:2028 length:198 start_codon:yes stop_codon:yes gene_type:complete